MLLTPGDNQRIAVDAASSKRAEEVTFSGVVIWHGTMHVLSRVLNERRAAAKTLTSWICQPYPVPSLETYYKLIKHQKNDVLTHYY